MAGNLCGADRATGDYSARNGNERHSWNCAPSLVLSVRPSRSQTDLRRRLRQCLEPGASPGTTESGYTPSGRFTANGHGLEPRRPNLFLHYSQYESEIRPDGIEVD